MNNKENQNHIESVCKLFEERKELFKNKNKNYGCSYIKAGEILNYILDNKELILKTKEDHVSYQILTRMLDKILRYSTLRFTDQDDLVGEKIFDTISDLSVYALMLAEMEQSKDNEKSKGMGYPIEEGPIDNTDE